MKIIAKFAFVLLVGVFVVFGGSTSAKAASGCINAACGACMYGCEHDKDSCITYGCAGQVQGCSSYCLAILTACQNGCYNNQ